MPHHTFKLNGKQVTVDVEDDVRLLWVLRDILGVKGPKYGCGLNVCKACTSPHQRQGVQPLLGAGRDIEPTDEITTIEGLAATVGQPLHPMQEAWIENDVAQCGYCQPGQIMAAVALVNKVHAEGRVDHRRRPRRHPQRLPLRHLQPDPRRHQGRRHPDVGADARGPGRGRALGSAGADRAEHPVRRLRQPRRPSCAAIADRRLGPRGRHGQPLRPQPHPRAARRRGAARGHADPARLPPDDRGPGPLGAGATPRPVRGRDLPRRGRPRPAGPRTRRCGPRGRAPGWRSSPGTPFAPYEDLLPELDMVLVMTVEPGFGGQSVHGRPAAQGARRARGGRPARRRHLGPGRRRRLRRDHRAVRRGGRGRVRRRLGRLRRRRRRRGDRHGCASWPPARAR